jgi:antitoxin (DNA-binding transcriptional repressor) of toxin-antitoxin stability system
MKRVTASEARRNWFKLLDEAAKGEVIAIQRDDKQLVLRLHKQTKSVPNYKKLFQATDADDADKWGWEWTASKGLKPAKRQ